MSSEKYIKVSRSRRAEKNDDKKKDKRDNIAVKVNTLLCSTDQFPLAKWRKYVKNGYVKRLPDVEIDGKVIEVSGAPNCVWISLPKELDQKIGCYFNWLFFLIKLFPEKQLIIDVQVLDHTNFKRTFKFDTRTNLTKLRHSIALLDLNIKPGMWNCLEMDLASLVSKNYGTRFVELCRIQIHGSCKLRRVFTTSSYVCLDEMPPQYRIQPMTSFNQVMNQV